MEYTAGLSYEQFSADQKTVEAVVWNLLIIGEAAKNVPEAIRTRHPDVLWRDMAGLRDIIVHQYFGIKLDVIWKVIEDDLPRVEHQIRKILEQEECYRSYLRGSSLNPVI